jgi:hypothetical protein
MGEHGFEDRLVGGFEGVGMGYGGEGAEEEVEHVAWRWR